MKNVTYSNMTLKAIKGSESGIDFEYKSCRVHISKNLTVLVFKNINGERISSYYPQSDTLKGIKAAITECVQSLIIAAEKEKEKESGGFFSNLIHTATDFIEEVEDLTENITEVFEDVVEDLTENITEVFESFGGGVETQPETIEQSPEIVGSVEEKPFKIYYSVVGLNNKTQVVIRRAYTVKEAAQRARKLNCFQGVFKNIEQVNGDGSTAVLTVDELKEFYTELFKPSFMR